MDRVTFGLTLISLTLTGVFCRYPTAEELKGWMSSGYPGYDANLLEMTPSAARVATDKITSVLQAKKYTEPEIKMTIGYVYDQYLRKAQAAFDREFNRALGSKYASFNVVELNALRPEGKQVEKLKESVGDVVSYLKRRPFNVPITTKPDGKLNDDFHTTLTTGVFGQSSSLGALVMNAYYSPEAHAMFLDRIAQHLSNTFDLSVEAIVALGLPINHYSTHNPGHPQFSSGKVPAGVDWPYVVADHVPKFHA